MGYYTTFKFTIKDLSNNQDEYYIKYLKLQLKEAFALEDDLSRNAKWYNFNDDLLRFSRQNENVLITCYGIGEEHYFNDTKLVADIWIAYYLNGKTYTDNLNYSFPEFSSDKLK